MARKITQEQYIDRIKIKHDNKYDYSLVNYINANSKIEIICPYHGKFTQYACNHLKYGCSACSKNKKLTNEQFIERSRKIHGDKYDYSLVNYINMHTKVKLICKNHGMFEQSPDNHLHKQGCPKCKESFGEKDIRLYLENNKIKYQQEKIVKNIGWFDFFIKKSNEIKIIEFHGQQHYFPVNFGSKDPNIKNKNFIHTVLSDYRKEKWCQENHYKYFAIPYWEKNKISEILDKFFNNKEIKFNEPPKKVMEYKKLKDTILS